MICFCLFGCFAAADAGVAEGRLDFVVQMAIEFFTPNRPMPGYQAVCETPSRRVTRILRGLPIVDWFLPATEETFDKNKRDLAQMTDI